MANTMHMKIRNRGLGIGGWHCTCCAPAKRERAAWCRKAKRAERNEQRREIEKALSSV